jgi:serine/threonine-protein kinase
LAPEDLSRYRPGVAGQPRLLADRYELIEAVGSGATAITWRARDRRLDRQVAIKVLRRDGEQDESYVQRFEREARTSASINHGNVVNVYDVGQQDGWLYLVMQLIDGEDLKHTIVRRGPLPATEAREITRQILAGLGAIHRAGILHRDIKPQNVLIDRDGTVRVTDFGIAQTQLEGGLTSTGTTVGTAAYMAPEQARAETLSEATDIYAVGVVLYEMLTGELPFVKPTMMATMLAHLQEMPVPPSRRMPGVPPLLDGVVMQAMAKDPADRFRTAGAMVRALDGSLSDPLETAPLPVRTPARPPERTRTAAPVQPRPVPPRTPPPPAQATSSGGGGRGVLTAMLVLLLLAMAAVAGWMYYEYTTRNDPETPNTPVATQQYAAPTDEPPPTSSDVIIEPPTDEEIAPPTDEPPATQEPTPEPTPEVTEEPTEFPIEPADGQVIEPDVNPDGN